MKIIVRGYVRSELRFEESVTVDDFNDVAEAALRHVAMVSGEPEHMLEIEFPDAPDAERFARFGTDPGLMVIPLKLDFPN